MKSINFEDIKRELEANNIKVDYVVSLIQKDERRGFTLDGYNKDAQVWVYVNNNSYIKMAKYNDAIRYEVRFGKELSTPLIRVDFDFEKMDSKDCLTPYMTVFHNEEQSRIALFLEGGVEDEIKGIFKKEIGGNLGELVEEFEDMLSRLLPSINASIMIFKTIKDSRRYSKN